MSVAATAAGVCEGFNPGSFESLACAVVPLASAVVFQAPPIPEPSTYLLMGAGIAAVVLFVRRKKKV
jgi:hypothetical protein